MPRRTTTRIVTHLSRREQTGQILWRLTIGSLCFTVFLWGGGILTFIVLHILQTKTSHHFIIPDIGIILLYPPVISYFFYVSVGHPFIMNPVLGIKLGVFGRNVIGEIVSGTARTEYQGDSEYVGFTDVEFETPNGVRHRLVVEGLWTQQFVRLRYDPFDLSNSKVIGSPRPEGNPVEVLLLLCVYGVFVLVLILMLVFSIAMLAVFLLSFFYSPLSHFPF